MLHRCLRSWGGGYRDASASYALRGGEPWPIGQAAGPRSKNGRGSVFDRSGPLCAEGRTSDEWSLRVTDETGMVLCPLYGSRHVVILAILRLSFCMDTVVILIFVTPSLSHARLPVRACTIDMHPSAHVYTSFRERSVLGCSPPSARTNDFTLHNFAQRYRQ